jgi:hypothetical protein
MTVASERGLPLGLGSYDPAEGAALVPTPRHVPRVLSWYLLLSSLIVGAVIISVFSTIWLLPVLDLRWTGDRRLTVAGQSTRGMVTGVHETVILGGRAAYTCTRYRFTFQVPDGTVVTGTSFRYRQMGTQDWKAGSDVTVEYDAADPRLSRVLGTSTGPIAPSFWTAATVLGSLAGLALAVRRLYSRLQALRLLRYGQPVASDQLLKFCHVDGSRIRVSDLQVNRPVLFDTDRLPTPFVRPMRSGTALAVNRLPVKVGPEGTWKTLVGWARVWLTLLLLVLLVAGGAGAASLIIWALD